MLIFEITMILITGILLWHALEEQSPDFVLVFWVGGSVFGFARELLVVHFTHLYTFGPFTITLGGVPVFYLLFWPNMIYVAMRWSENVLGVSFIAAPSAEQLYPIVFLVMTGIAIMIGAVGAQYQMLTYLVSTNLNLWGNIPVFVPFGYGLMGILFLYAIRDTWRNIFVPAKRAIRLLVWIPVLIMVHTGAMFVIKVGLDIFSGVIKLH